MTGSGKKGGSAGGGSGTTVEPYERSGEIEYHHFSMYDDTDDDAEWFKENGGLYDSSEHTTDENYAVKTYTASGFRNINKLQYTTSWEEMLNSTNENTVYWREKIADLHNALSTSTLTQGIQVNREGDFRIFGKKDMTMEQIAKKLDKSDGVLQVDGFLSTSAKPNGVPVAGSGLVLHFKIPPSTGAGAYVGKYSSHTYEREFLVNNNSVWKFDKSSMHKDKEGKIHITATWLGQTAAQTISPTYKKPRVSKSK